MPAQQVFTLDDHGQGSYLRTNQTKQICGLITYTKHVFREYNSGIEVRRDPFHPFLPEEWNQHTSTMLRTFLIQHLPTPIRPQSVTSGPISSSRPTGYSPAAIELISFKKGIKREITAYPSLKDERYFDGFKRSLFIVAKTHECSEVLDPNYTPGSEPEEEELFEAKQTFMFSVFNTNLQTDMGKTIVRRHLASTDAQAVWKELSEHMRTSSKGASEKRRLTQYVTNTVLDDNSKGTTEQFVLHFNEQFRQLEEISEDDERLPPTVKLTLLQTAVRSINYLRIVETLDEFQSTTHGHGSSTSLSYDTYYDLLLNACVRYDKTKKANIGKRRNVYKVLARAIKQSKIRQVRRSQTYMFGYLIPRNYMEAMQFDTENKNSKWYDAIKLEMESMLDYKVFKKWDKAILDKHKKVKNPPRGYHRIKVHPVFAVKFDGRPKARLVADGHLTPEPIQNIYSGVVSLRNLRLVIFLGKLNNLELWGADIGNSYLEAFTGEKLYIVAGPEFQELEGYILIFLKVLYGLKSSGKRWAEVIHGILRDMKFLPSKADPCIWLRKAPNLRCYEYISVYVDDICIAAESPSAIIQIFKSKYHLKVKGDGKLTYHLGADYFEDPDGTFVSQPKKYIDMLADTYKRLFNEDPPKGYKTPLDKNDHPELDTSEILEGDMAAKYLTMVGQLQWLVTLGRFDIHAQVATMSRFRAAPRQGHMDRLKRIYSYAIRTKDYAIRSRTEQPDYSFLPDQDFDWTYTVYGDVHEILPDDMPDPLGEAVTTTMTMDANLNHCLATGKSLTGCLHFVNKTPVDWYSKKQATVETATYGSEFVAAKTATEQIMDIRQTLRYLGAPITTKSFLFGDNRSVVTSATLPHSTLTKRHNILAFHRVREAIAAKLMAFYWIQSDYNLSDMLSKHWDHPTVYPRGNITLIPREATQEKEKEILNPQPEKEKKNQKENKNMK